MFDINIKWEHLTQETKKNIIDEFIANLCVEDMHQLLENIEYIEANAFNEGVYDEYKSFHENEFSFKRNEMYSTLEDFISRHFPFTLTI